jgi:hypothetical protein
MTCKKVRFMENNHAELTSGQITYSSQLASFPFTNAINKFRSKLWKPSGMFEIDATNNKLYINDGSDKTITIDSDTYDTPALLATEIQTKLNAASANWTVSYDSGGGTYKFTISNTGSVTLRFSVTTNAIWDDIGYVWSVDITGTSFVAGETRCHTSEFVIFDLGYSANIEFVSILGPLDELFSLTSQATIKIQGNNLNKWDTPPFDVTLTRTPEGIFQFFDAYTDTNYRYWRFYIQDRLNPAGPSGISIGHIYLGDYVTLTNRNIANGIEVTIVDPSVKSTSENGAIYFDEKTQYTRFDALNIQHSDKTDRMVIKDMFEKLGTYTPFYISIDPGDNITDDQELTKYVVFDAPPRFNHVIGEYFSIAFSLREVV